MRRSERQVVPKNLRLFSRVTWVGVKVLSYYVIVCRFLVLAVSLSGLWRKAGRLKSGICATWTQPRLPDYFLVSFWLVFDRKSRWLRLLRLDVIFALQSENKYLFRLMRPGRVWSNFRFRVWEVASSVVYLRAEELRGNRERHSDERAVTSRLVFSEIDLGHFCNR